jgi:alkanesulfonate monooxygenase SsuD/methylene tetrahydromethanopterin reductase-like flavin-dependent oxidoreductase (luciferase family)
MSAAINNIRRVHLAAGFPGGTARAALSGNAWGSQTDGESFAQFAQTAERGYLDFVWLSADAGESGAGRDGKSAGGSAVLAALAAGASMTEHVGLVGSVSIIFNEPYEIARLLASADHLSGGRLGWTGDTLGDGIDGPNFRRGDFLAIEERYARAREFLEVVQQLWSSWESGAVIADKVAGRFANPARVHQVIHRGHEFDVAATRTVPRSPQGRPVFVQIGDSPEARDFAVTNAEVLIARASTFEDALAVSRDVRDRVSRAGREDDSLRILLAASYAIGNTDSEARNLLSGPIMREDPTELVFVGAPETIAWKISRFVQAGAADGFLLLPRTNAELEEFVDLVVPRLHELGVLSDTYVDSKTGATSTLRRLVACD